MMKIKPEPWECALVAEVLNRAGVKNQDGDSWTEKTVAEIYEQMLPMIELRKQVDPQFAALSEKVRDVISKIRVRVQGSDA